MIRKMENNKCFGDMEKSELSSIVGGIVK